MVRKSEARELKASGDLSVDARNRKGLGRRVLVVGDAGTIEASETGTSRLLAAAGYEVDVVGNVCEALEAFYTDALPDVVVLDLAAVSSGWQFLLFLREDPKLGHIPVVSISADKGVHTVIVSGKPQDGASVEGAPVGPEALLSEVARAVPAQHHRAAEDRLELEDRLASLGRATDLLAHEINDPLAMMMINLSQSLEALRPPLRTLAGIAPVVAMLEDCQVGAARIQDFVKMLAHLSDRARAEARRPAQAP